MRAVVVYESLWGNTAAIARAIAEGIGEGAQALSTAAANPPAVGETDLVVAGSPVLAFGLPSEKTREGIRANPGKAPTAGGSVAPAYAAMARCAARRVRRARLRFDTQVRGPFGSAAPAILEGLERAGYRPVAKPVGFIVKGRYGPLRAGELERARRWGAELARAVGDGAPDQGR